MQLITSFLTARTREVGAYVALCVALAAAGLASGAAASQPSVEALCAPVSSATVSKVLHGNVVLSTANSRFDPDTSLGYGVTGSTLTCDYRRTSGNALSGAAAEIVVNYKLSKKLPVSSIERGFERSGDGVKPYVGLGFAAFVLTLGNTSSFFAFEKGGADAIYTSGFSSSRLDLTTGQLAALAELAEKLVP